MNSGWRIHDKQRLQSAIYRNLQLQQAEANTNLESTNRAEMLFFFAWTLLHRKITTANNLIKRDG